MFSRFTSTKRISNRRLFHASAECSGPRANWKHRRPAPLTYPPANVSLYHQVFRPVEMREIKKIQEKAAKSPWKGKWQIETVSIVERLPVIHPDVPKWYLDFSNLQLKISAETDKEYPDELWKKLDKTDSIKSDNASAKSSSSGNSKKGADKSNNASGGADTKIERESSIESNLAFENDDVIDESNSVTQSARRMRVEDFYVWPEGVEHLPGDFTPAPRVTEDDKKNNRHSLNRALSKRLMLIVQRKRDGKWEFMRSEWQSGDEPLDRHAQRCVEQRVLANDDCDFQVIFDTYHTQPSVHNITEFSLERQKKLKTFGRKQFFYHTYLLTGAPVVQLEANGYSDFAWVSKDELKEYFEPEFYNHIVDTLSEF